MIEFRNFLIASASTLGLLELTPTGELLSTETEPQSALIKAVLTLLAGVLTTVITRMFKNQRELKQRKRDHLHTIVKPKNK